MVRPFLILKTTVIGDLAVSLGYDISGRFRKALLKHLVVVNLDAGKAAQEVKVPVPEGCTDPSATNYDPTARSDDGSCVYQF